MLIGPSGVGGRMAPNERIHETQPAPPLLATAPLERRFTVGGVVSGTIQVWWKHLGAFTLMSLVVYAPLGITLGVLFRAAFRDPAPFAGPVPSGSTVALALGAVSLATIILAVVQAGAVTYGAVRHLQGGAARFGEMIAVGFRRGLPVVATGVLLSLAVLGGSLLFLVPGVFVAVATSVAVPAAVVERPGAFGALRRSFALTRGSRWLLFAAFLALLVIVWALAALVQVAATIAASLLLPPGDALLGVLVATQLGNAVFSALPLVGMAVAYHDLRVAKEGVGADALARVFE
jgi:hypothetical protein